MSPRLVNDGFDGHWAQDHSQRSGVSPPPGLPKAKAANYKSMYGTRLVVDESIAEPECGQQNHADFFFQTGRAQMVGIALCESCLC